MCPAIVGCAPVAAMSDIGERRRPGYGLMTWLKRATRKTQNAIARARFNIVYSFKLAESD